MKEENLKCMICTTPLEQISDDKLACHKCRRTYTRNIPTETFTDAKTIEVKS